MRSVRLRVEQPNQWLNQTTAPQAGPRGNLGVRLQRNNEPADLLQEQNPAEYFHGRCVVAAKDFPDFSVLHSNYTHPVNR
jgi:hypothetical protein